MSYGLNITKAAVLEEVSKTTAYEGAHSSSFDNTYVKEEDQESLQRYWSEACTLLTDTLKKYITTNNVSNDSYVVELTFPENHDSSLYETLESAAFSHLSNFIIGKWLEMLSLDKSQNYYTAASQALKEINSVILYRKAPTRPTT